MKKAFLKFYVIFSLLLGLVWTNSAFAQLPFAASFDFGGEIKGVIQDIQAAFKTVETNVVGTIKGSFSKLHAAYDKYSGKITKVFDKIPGTKNFKPGSSIGGSFGSNSGSIFGSVFGVNSAVASGGSSHSVDIYDAESVKEAFTELFLTYPSGDKKVQIAYDNKANKFYYDTLIEVKATITGLEEQLDKLRKEVENFSEQAMSAPEGESESGESDGATSSEDESGIIYNAYLSNRKFNDILKVTEEVVALQNQYFAAKLLRRPRNVAPAIIEKTQHNSFLQFNQTFANAQFLKIDSKKSLPQEEEKNTLVNLSKDTKVDTSVRTAATEKQVKDDIKDIKDTKNTSVSRVISTEKQIEDDIKDSKDEKSYTSGRSTTPSYQAKGNAENIKNTENNNVSSSRSPSDNNRFPSDNNRFPSAPDSSSPEINLPVLQQTQDNEQSPRDLTSGDVYSSTEYNTNASTDSDDFFAIPNAPETDSPLKYSQAELQALNEISEAQEIVNKAKDVHNLLQQLPTYKETFIQYDLIKKLHAKSVQSLEMADGCVIKYLNYYYNNSNHIWYGQSSAPENHCDYDNRQGLSGWAITAYQLANSSTGNNIDVNEMTNPVPGVEDGDPELVEINTDNLSNKSESYGFVTPDVNTEEYKDTVEDKDPEKMAEERDGDKEKKEDNFTDSNKAKEFSNTSREVSLINWQIGRQAAQMLVNDQNSANPQYGQAHRKYPLWNDLRSYYNQYIEGKYSNMKAYINQLQLGGKAIQLLEAFNGAITNDAERLENESAISAIEEILSESNGEVVDLQALIQAKEAVIANLKQTQNSKIAAKQSKVDNSNRLIDYYSQKISDSNKEINKYDGDANENGKTNENSREYNQNSGDSSQLQIDILNKRGANPVSSLFSQAREKLQGAFGKLSGLFDKLKNLRDNVKFYEKKRDKEKDKVAELNEKIAEIKIDNMVELLAEEETQNNIIAAVQESASSPDLTEVYLGIGSSNTSILPLISKVDTLVNKAKECAANLIDAHLANLKASAEGDLLYKGSNHQNIVNQHNQLIENLKNLPANCLINTVQSQIETLGISDSAILNILQNILSSAITESICSEVNCSTADDEYFVGLIARKRDFKAPKAAFLDAYPTVRDTVHFDTTDYKSIEKTKDGELTRDAFLDSGIILPEIWRRLLDEKAFVEKGVDLAAVLNKGGEDKAFSRGSLLPCRINNRYIVDINNNGKKYKIVDTHIDNAPENIERRNQLSDCRELEMGAHAMGLYTIKDKDVKASLTGNSEATSIEDPVSSELGMLLKFSNGRLAINDVPFTGFEKLVEKEKKAEKKGKYKLTAKENIYQRAMFTRNQIGDFLHFMNKEKEAREKLEQTEDDIAEVRETLKAALSNLGFELSDNVNLANEEDYQEIVQKLKSSKQIFMGQAQSKLGGNLEAIALSNADVYERFDKTKNTYNALFQDNQALINISDNTEAGEQLEESIETEKANKKVVEKSNKKAHDSLDDEIDNYEQPICIPNGTILPMPVETD